MAVASANVTSFVLAILTISVVINRTMMVHFVIGIAFNSSPLVMHLFTGCLSDWNALRILLS